MILSPNKLSWIELGIRSFSIKDWKFIGLLTIILIAGDVIAMVLTGFIGNFYKNSETEAIQQSVNF